MTATAGERAADTQAPVKAAEDAEPLLDVDRLQTLFYTRRGTSKPWMA